MFFASDNWAGAAPKVVEALAKAAGGFHPAYGNDGMTRAVEQRLNELFEHEASVFLVSSGTFANALSLTAFARPGGVVFCHEHAHIMVDEAGATSFLGGGITLTGIPGARGKLTPDAVVAAIDGMRDHVPHAGQPIALSLTNLTELGAVYTVAEVRALADVAHERGCIVHMDGARFANAVAALGVTPAELTWRSGVDVLSFGGTKNGCFAAEAVLFFDPAAARDVAFQRQRAGQGYSKNWFIAAQYEAYLADGHWLALAGNANRMAARLAGAIRASASARLAVEPDGNELFVVVKKDADARLKAGGAVYNPWSPDKLPASARPAGDETVIRLIASWCTTEADVDGFAALLGGA